MTDSEHALPLCDTLHRAPRWHGILIALAATVLVAGCWSAGFSGYDDNDHVVENKQLTAGLLDTFKPQPETPYYYPVTILSYHLDLILFNPWMPHWLGSWAPGIRLMSLLDHICAALLFWRILLALGYSPGQALCAAVIFAAHPLGCETVCWISERKNVLAGLFGLAAIYTWVRAEGRFWRLPLALLFCALALSSKPTALGVLPVLAAFELLGGLGVLRASRPQARSHWRPALLRLLPLVLLFAGALLANLTLFAHQFTTPPAGGSFYAAGLTDLEILVRYLRNMVLPDQLSAVYLVEVIRSATDPRALIYGLLLAGIVSGTLFLAANRRRAILGWAWFIGALWPTLNFIGAVHWMQDRYLYLSLPGALLVGLEVLSGLRVRLKAQRLFPALAGGYVLLLLVLALIRSCAWSSDVLLFRDAVVKQPRAAYARYAYGNTWRQAWLQIRDSSDPELVSLAASRRREWLENWQAALNVCPDVRRYTACFYQMSLLLGDEALRAQDVAAAQRDWAGLGYPEQSDYPVPPDIRALALTKLVELDWLRGDAQAAYAKAQEAVGLSPKAVSLLCRARAAFVLSQKRQQTGPETPALLAQAKADLQVIPDTSPLYAEANELLQRLEWVRKSTEGTRD